jgi:hypothetical protein
MNHLAMVLGQPTPEQWRMLQESVEQLNRQQKWM